MDGRLASSPPLEVYAGSSYEVVWPKEVQLVVKVAPPQAGVDESFASSSLVAGVGDGEVFHPHPLCLHIQEDIWVRLRYRWEGFREWILSSRPYPCPITPFLF